LGPPSQKNVLEKFYIDGRGGEILIIKKNIYMLKVLNIYLNTYIVSKSNEI
jgi:hypothetical protein